MCAVIFANYPLTQNRFELPPFVFGLYYGLGRIAWSIAVSYIIFACNFNYGGIISEFLSHSLWQPLSKLSFGVFLFHFPLQMLILANETAPPYLSEFAMVCLFVFPYICFGCSKVCFHCNFQVRLFILSSVITFSVCIIVTLAFEMPISKIERCFSFKALRNPTHRNAAKDKIT